MRALVRLIGPLLLVLACGPDRPAWARQAAATGTPESRAAAALRTGKYDEAITLYRDLAAQPAANPRIRRSLVRALSEVGRYEEAAAAARAPGGAPAPELARSLAEVLLARGRRGAAETLLVVAAARASDSLTARVRLAELHFARGNRDEAMREFARFIDIYNRAGRGRLSSEDLAAVAQACQYLGRDDPQLFKDALRAYDAAIAADSSNLEARARLGQLFVDKYRSPEARQTVDAVLAINPRYPPALVVAARLAAFDGQGTAASLVRRALAVNDSLGDAHAFLAALLLDAEDHPAATREAEKALAIDPTLTEAHAVVAAVRELSGDAAGFEAAKRRAVAGGVSEAEFYTTLAQIAARNRLYGEARQFALIATKQDPKAWRAWSVLGLQELRTGDPVASREHLERAFKGDPYDPWVKNTLDLLDTFQKDFRESRTRRFQFFFEGKEADLLAIYAGPLAEEAFDSLSARYGYVPPTPVRVEVFGSHADFSVRTVGLAGLGALGVSFGSVLAMDSPSARATGEFNWGSTLWHEIAHAFTLGMTHHRVPRWLSEGLSVMEERRARPGWGWGMDATPDFLLAYKAGRLPPPTRLNDAFIRPAYPAQVMHAYEEASLVCEMIEREMGHRAIIAMLDGYRDGLTSEQVLQRALGLAPAAFDQRFDAFVRSRYATALGAMRPVQHDSAPGGSALSDDGELAHAMRDGIAAFDAGRFDEAAQQFETARRLFPEYGGEGSAYAYLARVAERRGDARRAVEELSALTARDEANARANLALADALEKLGDRPGAARALERLIFIAPFDPAMHERLARLAAGNGDRLRTVLERRAIVALGPTDQAEARYQLALALRDAGEVASARREILKALDLAPGFEKAQALLLALHQ